MKTTAKSATAIAVLGTALTTALLVGQAHSAQASVPAVVGRASSAPEFSKGGELSGARSKASIMNVIMRELPALRELYNSYLKTPEAADLEGKVTVKFAVDEHGAVIFSGVVQSTTGNPGFDGAVVATVGTWSFGGIDKPGDVTEVVYPFVFSQ